MSEEKSADAPTITINYLKSNSFREVACDGVLGGPTPRGKFWLAFFTERYPLPRIVRHKVTNETDTAFSIEDEGEVIEGRQGMIRNVEFGVYVSMETAEYLHQWLGRNLAEMKSESGGEE